MIHYVIEGMLGVAVLFLAVYVCLYRRQIRDISRQLQFHRQEESNHKISVQLRGKEWILMQEELNELLEGKRLQRARMLAEEKRIMDMITNVSHDIRTPLTSISGYFQMYCESDHEENRKRYQTVIEGRLKALADMLEEFFTYFKIKSGQMSGDMEVCDVRQILYETLFLFYDDMKKQGIEPEFDIAEERVEIIANEENVRRIFFNVIKNALVHGVEKLMVQMEQEKEYVRFIFKNKTYEAVPKDLDNVFERFYSGDKSRNNGSTGLGLSIAKELVEDAGGTIWAFTEGEYFGIGLKLKRKR